MSEKTEDESIKDGDLVTLTSMGHLSEIQFMEKMNRTNAIRKLSKNEYLVLETGEVKQFNHIENRSGSYNSLRQTFKKLRYLINNNFVGAENELFVTLTYADKRWDNSQVYKDLDKYIKRLKYRYKNKSTVDYLNVVEPHADGSFHIHSLIRFNELKKIYIPNAELAKLWGHGFVTIKSMKNIDNIGAYLSVYLTDIELNDETNFSTVSITLNEKRELVEKEIEGQKKKFIKGGRLHMYPKDMKIYRCSRGVKPPNRQTMTYKEAKKIVGSAEPHYKKTITVHGADGFENTIRYEQYNSKRL